VRTGVNDVVTRFAPYLATGYDEKVSSIRSAELPIYVSEIVARFVGVWFDFFARPKRGSDDQGLASVLLGAVAPRLT
jgi:hypothetical protein